MKELFEDIEDIGIQDIPLITKDEYIEKAREIFFKIFKVWGNSREDRYLTDEEADTVKRDASFTDGKTGEVRPFIISDTGEYYCKDLDTELFSAEIEELIFYSDLLELINPNIA